MKYAALILALTLPVAAPSPAQADDFLEMARQRALIGAFDEAEQDFNSALQQATTKQARAEIKVEYADALSRTAPGRQEEAKLNKRAADLYEAGLPDTSGAIRVRAANNYGALLLRQEKAEGAVQVLKSVKQEPTLTADNESYALYLYNLGRAYELLNQPQQARVSYEESARADPSFDPAARAVSRVLSTQPATADHVVAAAAWIDTLTDRGDLSLADEVLGATFARASWTSQTTFPHVLRALTNYLAAARLPVEDFTHTWEARLQHLPQASPQSRQIGVELIRAYSKDLPITFDPAAPAHLFEQSLASIPPRPKDGSPAAILARLLKAVGDAYVEKKDFNRGLQRYSLASALDLHGANIDASLYAANLLLVHGESLDPTGAHLNALVSLLFEGKGGAYGGQNWEDILRFHTVLGTIFQQRAKWGSESDPRSAVFQFEHARQAHRKLAQGSSPPEPVNVLLVNLAKSYDGAKRPDQAFRTYLDAGEGALPQRDDELVREALNGAGKIEKSHPVSEQDAGRLNALRVEAKKMDVILPQPPIDLTEISLANATNRLLGETGCFRATRSYKKMVSDFGEVAADTQVVETERKGRQAPVEVLIDSQVDQPRQILVLLCVSHTVDDSLQDQAQIGKLRFDFATGSPLIMPIANVSSDAAWIQLSPIAGDSQRSYLRPLVIPLRKPFSNGRLVRVALIDESRELEDSADPGLTMIKLMVGKKAD